MSRGKSVSVTPELPKSLEALCEWPLPVPANVKLTKRHHRGNPLRGNNFHSASGPRCFHGTSPLAVVSVARNLILGQALPGDKHRVLGNLAGEQSSQKSGLDLQQAAIIHTMSKKRMRGHGVAARPR